MEQQSIQNKSQPVVKIRQRLLAATQVSGLFAALLFVASLIDYWRFGTVYTDPEVNKSAEGFWNNMLVVAFFVGASFLVSWIISLIVLLFPRKPKVMKWFRTVLYFAALAFAIGISGIFKLL